MKQIVVNSILVLTWVFLTGCLAWLIHSIDEKMALGALGGIGLWLAGQAVILSPILYMTWRDRKVGNAPESS